VLAFGGVDILVCNAGLVAAAPVDQLGEETWERHFDVNVKGAWLAVREAVRIMKAQGRGAILLNASKGAFAPTADNAAYASSKASVAALARNLAVELGPHNIRVNYFNADFVDTPLQLPGRKLAVVADEANAEKCAKGMFCTFVVDLRAEENPVPISTLPAPKERDFCGLGTVGPHNLHENRPGTFRSEETIFATYNVAGVRVFDIRDAFAPKEIAFWVPPPPKKLIDPRPNIALAAKAADILVTTDGVVYVTDWNAGLNVLQYEG